MTIINSGAKLPETLIHIKSEGDITETSLHAWGQGRRVVLIIVPGAFTPTCSARHLPGYVEHANAFAEKGIDALGCMAVNDIHVMSAWAKAVGAQGKVDMLADASGAAAAAMEILTVDVPVLGNVRAARLALVAEDGIVKQIYIEKPAAFEVSSAEHVLAQL